MHQPFVKRIKNLIELNYLECLHANALNTGRRDVVERRTPDREVGV